MAMSRNLKQMIPSEQGKLLNVESLNGDLLSETWNQLIENQDPSA